MSQGSNKTNLVSAIPAQPCMNSVSVIIPVHNRPELLLRALRSVARQTLPASEIIVVDDGSDPALAESLPSEYMHVKVLRQDHSGVSAARNLGIQSSKTEWIALLDSDDEWLPEKLRLQMELLQGTDYKFCHSDEIWIRNGRRVNAMKKHGKQGGRIYERCLPLCVISPSASVIHRSVFDEVGLFDETLPACEDYDMWLRICCKLPVLYTDKKLIIKHGGHEDQLSRRYWGMDRFRIQALNKILASGELNPAQQQKTLSEMNKKIHVYIAGARKRNKHNEATYYKSLLESAQQQYSLTIYE